MLRRSLFIGGMVWVLSVFANQGLAQTETYQMREIIFIPWGEGERKVGLRVTEILIQGLKPAIRRYGAERLEVDKDGNIYVWDTVAHEKHPYDSSRLIAKPKSNKILKYVKEKKKGEKIEEYKYAGSIPLTLKGLTTKGKPFEVEKFKSNYQDYQCEMYWIVGDFKPKEGYFDQKRGIKIKDGSGNLLGEAITEALEIDFLGFDSKGNLYILHDTTRIKVAHPGIWQLEVYKYSKEGNLLSTIKLLTEDLDWTNRFDGQKDRIAFDGEGNIYHLLAKKDGVHIYKWEIKR